jgi:hypothetical protein
MKKHWSPEEDRKLVNIYPQMHNMEVAEAMHRSYGSIVGRAQVLGLKKDPAYIHEMLMKEAQKLKKSGEAYRYKPGGVSYNKGKRLSESIRDKVSKTFFPKGNKPWNTKEVGHERITKDGYLMVKLRDRQYVLKHKWMWESEHGRVPAGYALKFIDGNPLNCVLGNLRLISRAENMANNTIHNLPEDLKELIRLKNKINRICDAKE